MKVNAERIDAYEAAPGAMDVMYGVETYLKACCLERSLFELVKMRASQINGCAYCLDLHSRDARRNDETEQRLYLLSAWRDSRLYSPSERAALAWTEALTAIADTQAPDAAYADLREHFSAAESTDLTLLICQINSWNRIAIGFRYRHP